MPENTRDTSPQAEAPASLAPTANPLPSGRGLPVTPIRPPVMSGPFEVRTMRELGPQLPVGFVHEGRRVRNFRLRPFRLKDERALSEIREKRKGLTMGEFVASILSHMVQTVGGHAFDMMKDGDRRLVIASLPMADALYMYLYLRADALGIDEPVPLNLQCPSCRARYKFRADLGSLEVRVVPDSIIDLRRTYTLRDGIDIGGQTRHTLYMEPLKWGAFERREFSASSKADREIAVIRHSVVGVEGVDQTPFMLHVEQMEDLTKYDLEGITRDIEDNGPGPQMVIEAKCSGDALELGGGCGAEYLAPIEWDYDSLFSRASSQPAKHRT